MLSKTLGADAQIVAMNRQVEVVLFNMEEEEFVPPSLRALTICTQALAKKIFEVNVS